jgi:hypothetical protein
MTTATALTTTNNEPPTMALIQMAMDKDMDADKLEKLMQLHERAQDREAEREFAEAMNLCQSELPRIVRDATNSQTSSKYARLESLDNQIKPVYIKHGFTLTFGTDTSPIAGHIRITCICQHVGGHKRTYQGDFPLDDAGIKGGVNKTPMHATGSTMSYGRRYLTLMIFNLVMAGEDNDGNRHESVETITDDQAVQIKELLEEAGMPLAEFLKMGRIARVEDLLVSRHPNALEAIRIRREKNRGAT